MGARNRGGSPHRIYVSVLKAVLVAALAAGALTSLDAAGSTGRPLTRFALASASERVGAPAAVPVGTVRLGPAPRSAELRIDIVLRPRDPAALSSFALAVSTPGNVHYHHFLKRGEFGRVFGATLTTIRTVDSTLRTLGLAPGAVTSDHLIVPVRTTAGEAESAFHVVLDQYRLRSGRLAIANATAPRLPRATGRFVEAVVGLDNLVRSEPAPGLSGRAVHRPGRVGPGPHVSGPAPCSRARSAASEFGGWTENALARAYSLQTLYSRGDLGKGATIALYELSAYSSSDISVFKACYGVSTSVTNVKVDGGTTSTAGLGEAELDIEVVIGLAPKASLLVYEAPNGGAAALDEYDAIARSDRADVVSSSWGLCELFEGISAARAKNTIFEEMASQGQSMLAVPGDEGSEGCLPNDFGSIGIGLGKGSEPRNVAVDPGDSTAYVANLGSGTVSVVNVLSGQVVKTIGLGKGTEPFGVAVDPTRHRVYVTEANADAVEVIDGATCNAGKTSGCGLIGKLETGSSPASVPDGVAVDPNTKTVYVAAADYHAIEVFNELSGKFVSEAPGGENPEGIAVNVATNEVYFAIPGDDAVGAFLGDTCDASNTSRCGNSLRGVVVGNDPTSVAVDASLRQVYASNYKGDTVVVLDESSGNILKTVSLAGVAAGPLGLAVAPDGPALLVSAYDAWSSGRPAGVVVISLHSDSAASADAVTSLLSAGNPVAVASDPLADEAVAAAYSGGALVLIPLAVDPWDPATQPFVTGVGGTDLISLGPKPTETVWDEHLNPGAKFPEGAGGGGISAFWGMPSYQSGPGVKNSYSSGGPCGRKTGYCREVPDVSASADPTHGYIVFEQGQWTSIGGTSAATPLWAAIVGLLDVQQGSRHRVGFLNPTLYKRVAAGDHIVNDITAGNDDYTTTAGGRFPATKSYDMASGLGTPFGTGLSKYVGFEPRPAITSMAITHTRAGAVVTITGSGLLWTSTVTFGHVRARSFTVVSPTTVRVLVPAGTGTVHVSVVTPGGRSAPSSASTFTY